MAGSAGHENHSGGTGKILWAGYPGDGAGSEGITRADMRAFWCFHFVVCRDKLPKFFNGMNDMSIDYGLLSIIAEVM